MKANEYKCAMCGNIYEKTRSDKEALKECEENFGLELTANDNLKTVCDDCFQKILPSKHPEKVLEAQREFKKAT